MHAEIATRALGGTWRNGRGMAMCPVHDNRNTPALSLADGENGKLLVHCFAGCDGRDVLRELNNRGVLTDPLPALPVVAEKTLQRDRSAFALKLWREGSPLRGTVAELYLCVRGIDPPFPQTLRFHPSLLHAPSQSRHPAMIGLVTTGADNLPTGLHRTYLARNGHKADLMPCKMMFGACAGGAVRLSDEGDGPLVICEGLETGLSLRDALSAEMPTPRVWAALSTSGISGLLISSLPTRIVIAPDGDAPGNHAATKLAERAKAEGIDVRIMSAPPGKDWNDLVRDPSRGGVI